MITTLILLSSLSWSSSNQNYKFMRIDADVTDALKEDVSEEDMKSTLDDSDRRHSALPFKENLDVKVEKLKDASISSMITLSEETAVCRI